jgi:hypothetical protein
MLVPFRISREEMDFQTFLIFVSAERSFSLFNQWPSEAGVSLLSHHKEPSISV